MVQLTEAQLLAAEERGRLAALSHPRATGAIYNRNTGRMVLTLTNGSTVTFQPRHVQGREGASDDEIADVEILGAGYALHWELSDVDLSIPAILNRQLDD